jgi:enoyl-CoA hydratase/carnithine racemase
LTGELDPSEALVLYERRGQISFITLNRPTKLNALSDELIARLADVLDEFDQDDEARVAILSGNGSSFCSGADVRQRHLRTREEFEKQGGPARAGLRGDELMHRATNWKPVVAAVHGYAYGAGLGLALTCEIVVTAEDAKLQVTETPRGLSPIRYWSLLHFLGAGAFATDVALTGRVFSGREAAERGVVSSAVPSGDLMAAAQQVAEGVAGNPPLAVRAAVRSRRWALAQVERESRFQAEPLKLHLSSDFAESARAFVDKRASAPSKGE